MDPHTIRKSRVVLDGLRRVYRLLRETSRQSEKSIGLTGSQQFVLSRFLDADGLSVNDLAGRTFTHQSTVSETVSLLARKRLLLRGRSPQDRRALCLSLTERGRRLLRKAPGLAQERLLAALGRMPRKRLEELAAGLEALVREAGLGEAGLFHEAPRGGRRRA